MEKYANRQTVDREPFIQHKELMNDMMNKHKGIAVHFHHDSGQESMKIELNIELEIVRLKKASHVNFRVIYLIRSMAQHFDSHYIITHFEHG